MEKILVTAAVALFLWIAYQYHNLIAIGEANGNLMVIMVFFGGFLLFLYANISKLPMKYFSAIVLIYAVTAPIFFWVNWFGALYWIGFSAASFAIGTFVLVAYMLTQMQSQLRAIRSFDSSDTMLHSS